MLALSMLDRSLVILQLFVGIATIATAILAWRTLVEMQIERDNAYRPEIVVMPNTFNGSKVYEDEINMDKRYFIFLDSLFPETYTNLYVPIDRDMIVHRNAEGLGYFLIERPYLCLKNIGHGIAKDVEIVFSVDWVEEVVEELNSNFQDEYMYSIDFSNESYKEYVPLYYVSCAQKNHDKPDWETLVRGYCDDNRKDGVARNITYIANDEEPVKVDIPDEWCEMLAFLINQKLRTMPHYEGDGSQGTTDWSEEICVPDIHIFVRFHDMQGKQMMQEMYIPCECFYSQSIENEVYTKTISLSFYRDYIR